MAGIAHFSNFFRWMEAAEVAFLRERGLSVAMEWNGSHLGFPRVSAQCDYIRPARFQDVLDIDVTLEHLGSKSIKYAFVFSRGGEVLARGKITCACCDVGPDNQLKAILIPDDIRALLQK